jgi:hypothetical protein
MFGTSGITIAFPTTITGRKRGKGRKGQQGQQRRRHPISGSFLSLLSLLSFTSLYSSSFLIIRVHRFFPE